MSRIQRLRLSSGPAAAQVISERCMTLTERATKVGVTLANPKDGKARGNRFSMLAMLNRHMSERRRFHD